MGNVNPTPRLQRFIDMGFSVEETRMALAACNDDEARARELLLERRADVDQLRPQGSG